MRILHTVWICLFLFTNGVTYCQEKQGPYLLLHKAGSNKSAVFYEGEEIRYKMKGEDHFRRAHIAGLRGDTIRFHYQKVSLAEIEVVDIRGKNFQKFSWSSAGDKVIVAGAVYMLADYVNQELIQDDAGGVSEATFVAGGSIIAAGIIMKFLKQRYFRTGGRNILEIVNLRRPDRIRN
jgi:hypothetical protein